MVKTHSLLSLALALGLVLAACAPSAPPTPPTATPTPTPSEPALGSTMEWFDGSLLVYVPGGPFIMGRPGQEDNPEREVSINGFWFYRTKVTNAQYLKCVAAGACTSPAGGSGIPDPASPEIKDRPVVGVSYEQAASYCAWMQGRLPSEVEWEKAARGPDGNLYPWGNTDPACHLTNFNNCYGETTRVFDFPDGQSYYYALDMSGNVYEWVLDWYRPTPDGSPSATLRSVRGSNYKDGAEQIQPSRRSYLEPAKFRADLGFRCVIPQPGESEETGGGFQPYCKSIAYVPGQPDGNDPKDGQPAPGPQNGPATCEPPVLDLSVASYCAQAPSLGAANVVVSYSGGSGAYVGFSTSADPGPNCTYDADLGKFICIGPADTNTTIQLCAVCTKEDNSQSFATPTCDAGYLFNPQTMLCEWIGDKAEGPIIKDGNSDCPPGYYYDSSVQACIQGVPLNMKCPKGFSFDPQANCCTATVTDLLPDPQKPESYPAFCPPGTVWQPNLQVCVPDQPGGPTKVISCQTYTVYLGNCQQGGQSCFQPGQYTTAASCSAAGCLWVAKPTTQRDPYCTYP